MATFTLDDSEIEELYLGCKSHEKELKKLHRDMLAQQLSPREMSGVTERLKRNMSLREILNPRAEEEAREEARRRRGDRRDPRQLEIPLEVGGRRAERADGAPGSASPNGKKTKPPKRLSTATVVDGLDVANPTATQEPTDEFIVEQLRRGGVDGPQGIVDLWMSSERESALAWAQLAIANPDLGTPEMPPHVWQATWVHRYDFDPRAATPTAAGVCDNKLAVEGWREYWIEVGPWHLIESRARKGRGPGKWLVSGDDGSPSAYSGPNRAKAERVAIVRNRDAAVSRLLTEVRQLRIAKAAGDSWTTPKPPKLAPSAPTRCITRRRRRDERRYLPAPPAGASDLRRGPGSSHRCSRPSLRLLREVRTA